MKASSVFPKPRHLLPVLAGTLLIGGCGLLGERDSADRAETPPLEVPPDLVAPEVDGSFRIPDAPAGRASAGGAASNVQTQAQERSQGTAMRSERVLSYPEGVRVVRDGPVRWLEVDMPPDELWPRLRAFFDQQDVPLARHEPRQGLLETEWMQMEAGVPIEGGIRQLIGRVFGDSYDASTRDQFRVRVEPDGDSAAVVFVSHRSTREVAVGQDEVRWRMAPADPEAEARMLVQIMSHLGPAEEQAAQAVAEEARDVTPSLRITQMEGEPVLEIQDRFLSVWRRLGVMLDRASLLVDDQDRSAGTYFVTYRPEQDAEEGGFLSRLFGSEEAPALRRDTQYRILLGEAEGRVRIVARDQEGEILDAQQAEAVLERIRNQFEGVE
ncbi:MULTISPECIES: outer membrane protein assembly factor BamC [unclassified Ectothiorhodospira]|uniref:outer membrane protein assembly factor BamC n=1 Tax=unclassified Ectothiorhodospira TaxID=2684909 RepID=UPI001EE91CB4|nr:MULTISPECIES: outer membrane protein assembly factor BamC [unclassified Ectothiorhodospira]MCG5516307.1 outer membrane protein assembly factor BamC [Ectothiorhodospira sp. 9100]MCG5519314.1 outer membrane protein assembly factor BamC [Ectothiorhodospira sp. 9905]